jgi:hypothetical protein
MIMTISPRRAGEGSAFCAEIVMIVVKSAAVRLDRAGLRAGNLHTFS